MACHRADPGHQRRAIEINIGAALSALSVRRYQRRAIEVNIGAALSALSTSVRRYHIGAALSRLSTSVRRYPTSYFPTVTISLGPYPALTVGLLMSVSAPVVWSIVYCAMEKLPHPESPLVA